MRKGDRSSRISNRRFVVLLFTRDCRHEGCRERERGDNLLAPFYSSIYLHRELCIHTSTFYGSDSTQNNARLFARELIFLSVPVSLLSLRLSFPPHMLELVASTLWLLLHERQCNSIDRYSINPQQE